MPVIYLIIQEGSAQPRKVSPNTRHLKGFAKILQAVQLGSLSAELQSLLPTTESHFAAFSQNVLPPFFFLHRKTLSSQEGEKKSVQKMLLNTDDKRSCLSGLLQL